jgi:protoporphyrinogen oxidase
MFEISSSVAHKPVENDSVVADTVLGAIRVGLVSKDSEIVSVFHRREERGYPTPSIGRDSILEEAFHHLEQHQIYSRGRFGSWKYEVSNQDHSFMLGVECADRIVSGSSEITLQTPHEINGTKGVKQMDRKYISGADKD